MDFNMDERKIRILQAIIQDYIITGEPVGSRTIAKKYDLGVSSATIRNEMSDLEEMGLIEQLHTSSGRKPSDIGYRLYVDKLIKLSSLTPEEELKIKSQLITEALYEVDEIVKKSIVLLSELTNLTCIVKTTSVRTSSIKLIKLLQIDINTILAVIITQNGMINNNVIRVNKTIDSNVLQKFSNFLNNKLYNLTIQDINLKVINELKSGLTGYEDIFDAIITALYDALNKCDNSKIYYKGATNIFNYPEYNDIEKARQFLALLDDKKVLDKLLTREENVAKDGMKVSISIGRENLIKDAQECSILSANYTLGEQTLGTIGVIGPTRMQYSKIISLLTQFIRILNDNIGQIYEDR
ncbi:heat-inducible transcriptional repressor HrcA [Clostridium botulinum]|nr:heat-inducible transcriptional repressor HrcA [Clostridium botulinum]